MNTPNGSNRGCYFEDLWGITPICEETSKTEISKIRCQIGIFTALPKIQLKNITQQYQSQFLLSQVFKNGM